MAKGEMERQDQRFTKKVFPLSVIYFFEDKYGILNYKVEITHGLRVNLG